MKTTSAYCLVLITAPNVKTARQLAQAALQARLVACVNLISGIESHYWWQGKKECGKEVLLLMKTASRQLAKLEKLVLAKHPYDTPEFIALTLRGGNARYLDWIRDNCR